MQEWGWAPDVHGESSVVRILVEPDLIAAAPDGSLWFYWATPGSSWNSTQISGPRVITSAPSIFVRPTVSGAEADIVAQGPSGTLLYFYGTPGTAESVAAIQAQPSQNLGLAEQYQQETNWCWAATAVSIALYYDPASTWTQCSLANKALNQTTCCSNGASSACNQPWYLDRVLAITGHLHSTSNGKSSFQGIINEISAGRPIGIRIAWNGTGAHFPAVDGFDNRGSAPTIDLQDPIFGPSTQDFNSFPGSYQGGATWTECYFTS